MANLGEFGAALAELDPNREKDTFTFFGREFTVEAEMPPMLHFQIAAVMSGKLDDTEGAAAMWEAQSISLGAEQFAAFYRLAIEKRADLDSLMMLTMALFQGGSGHPTVEVSDSPVGLLPTSQSSNTSPSAPPAFGEDGPHDATTPTYLRPVSQVQAG